MPPHPALSRLGLPTCPPPPTPLSLGPVTTSVGSVTSQTVIEYKPGFGVLSDALLRAGAGSVTSIVKESGADG